MVEAATALGVLSFGTAVWSLLLATPYVWDGNTVVQPLNLIFVVVALVLGACAQQARERERTGSAGPAGAEANKAPDVELAKV